MFVHESNRISYCEAFADWTFSDTGIYIKPLLRKSISIEWCDIEFISTTPALEKIGNVWAEEKYLTLGESRWPPGNYIKHFGFLELKIVIKDRRHVFAKNPGWARRLWMNARFRPMLDARDAYLPDQSCLKVTVKTERLEGSWQNLIEFISGHCRFDLVVSSD